MEVAQRLANGPRSLSLIRKAYWQSWGNSYEQQLEPSSITERSRTQQRLPRGRERVLAKA